MPPLRKSCLNVRIFFAGITKTACHTTKRAKRKHIAFFRNTSQTTSDVGKTTSYVEKIISDIIQITSDLFSASCNLL